MVRLTDFDEAFEILNILDKQRSDDDEDNEEMQPVT